LSFSANPSSRELIHATIYPLYSGDIAQFCVNLNNYITWHFIDMTSRSGFVQIVKEGSEML